MAVSQSLAELMLICKFFACLDTIISVGKGQSSRLFLVFEGIESVRYEVGVKSNLGGDKIGRTATTLGQRIIYWEAAFKVNNWISFTFQHTRTHFLSVIYYTNSTFLYANAHKTEYMWFNQTGDISTLNGSSLKLVDKFTYPGSSVSSTETDIDTWLTKAWKAINRLSVI